MAPAHQMEIPERKEEKRHMSGSLIFVAMLALWLSSHCDNAALAARWLAGLGLVLVTFLRGGDLTAAWSDFLGAASAATIILNLWLKIDEVRQRVKNRTKEKDDSKPDPPKSPSL